MNNQLIIFDCDGVLVDSEMISSKVIAEELTIAGLPMKTEEAFDLFAGSSAAKVYDYYLQKTGRPLPETVENNYRKKTFNLFKKELQPIAGITIALSQIPFAKCVGSNGPLDKIKLNLEYTGLRRHFMEEHLFSAYEIKAWKPDPALYLHAAEVMGFENLQCTVVEDSVHGVQAATAAGMRVLGFSPYHNGKQLEKEGAEVFNSMDQLPKLLGL